MQQSEQDLLNTTRETMSVFDSWGLETEQMRELLALLVDNEVLWREQ